MKDDEAALLSISPTSVTEQTHAKVTESKYSQLLISTITHDLKSPITAIQGNIDALNQYISPKGKSYLSAAQISIIIFEYYVYDLIVFFFA